MARKILFWILFPIISALIAGLLIFYLDMANGPLIFFIIECGVLLIAFIARIVLMNQKFVFRMIPFLTVVAVNVIILPFAKPAVEVISAVNYSNPKKTEVLTLKNGDVQGVYNKDKSVRVYAGIPYAEAPVGDLRWKEPVPISNWEGVKDCTHFAAQSMQKRSNPIINSLVDIYSIKGWRPDFIMHPEQNMSEDSLYLNIWRPNNNKTNLPILMYVHGGSLTSGSSASRDFNGEEMAKKDVIMITVQYRLGVFGYFAHNDLISESENHTTGNYGLLDQIEALKWVNENATYFGGDKNNITIAGESAGSSSISAMCTSPLAKGLFKRAIGESSSLVVKIPPHTYRSKEAALKMGNDILKEFNCKNVEELRKIPADKLVNTKYDNSAMTLDGYALTKNPYDVYKENDNNEEALLNGYNVLEADAFVIPKYLFTPTNKDNIKGRLLKDFNEETTEKLMNVLKDEIEKDAFSTFNKIYSAFWFIYPHHSWSNMALENGETVYRYQFTKENGYHSSYHAGEIIYVYGNVKKDYRSFAYNQSDYDLSETMLSYWANFAKNGNPNGDSLPTWSSYQNDHDTVMELGKNIGPIEDKYLQLYPIFDDYINSL